MESLNGRPPFGSVESHVQTLQSHRGENFYACAFGVMQGIAMVTYLPAETSLAYIRNVVTAVDQLRAERPGQP